jgi:hypothetical protein
MSVKLPTVSLVIVFLFSFLSVHAESTQTEFSQRDWLEKWEKQNKSWRVMHLGDNVYDDIDAFKEYINHVLVPMKYNVIVLSVGYAFDFKSYPQLSYRKINKNQARDLAVFCREKGIRLIPLFNCVGHQSWLGHNHPLLLEFPQFDETPHVGYDNKGIYCREWCPLHPEVNKVVFALIDEIIDAFEADAVHIGMDEIFLCGYPPEDQTPWELHTDWKPGGDGKTEPFPDGPPCPRCKGKNQAELIAKAVTDFHRHIVEDKGLEMLMWGDRLLDGSKMSYHLTEASKTGSHKAIDMISKDIIICDWHYSLGESYPSIEVFQEKGFRVLPSVWNDPNVTSAFLKYAEKTRTEKLIGTLSCSWSASPKQLLQAMKEETTEQVGTHAQGIIKSMKVITQCTE